MITVRFAPRFFLPFGVAYGFMLVLSVLLLVPHYLSATFDSTRYMSIPFMTQVSAELSEHSLSLPFFFAVLAVLLPLVSIASLSFSFASIKVSETCRYEFISQKLKTSALLLVLASFIPMTWIGIELITINASFLSSAFQSLQGFITSTVLASQSWMATYGQIGLFMSMILSSIVTPIPNEVILTFAGMTMSPFNIALFGGMGSTVGAVICFYIARLGGKPLAKKFIKEDNLTSMDRCFHRWGSWAILLGRLIPFIPFDAVSYLSGLTKTRVGKFVSLTFLGSIPRCLFYAYLGEIIAVYNLPVLLVLILVGALLFLFFKFRKIKLTKEKLR